MKSAETGKFVRRFHTIGDAAILSSYENIAVFSSDNSTKDFRYTLTAVNCPAGKFQNGRGMAECKICTVGMYASGEKNKACRNCEPGQYQHREGREDCKKCPQGKYSSSQKGIIDHYELVDGVRYQLFGSLFECSECPDGRWQGRPGGKECFGCPKGKFSRAMSVTFAQSREGFGSLAGFESLEKVYFTSSTIFPVSCISCFKGQYASTNSASSCNLCLAGQYSEEIGQFACKKCGYGQYQEGASNNRTEYQSCKDCEPGKYSGGIGKPFCLASLPCAPGKYDEDRNKRAILRRPDSSRCIPCPPGHKCRGGLKDMEGCKEHTYQDELGASRCKTCPVGRHTVYDSIVNASKNPLLFLRTSVAACRSCEINHFLNESQMSCQECQPEEFQNTRGRTFCRPLDPCVPGTYDADRGKHHLDRRFTDSRCTPCEVGYFCEGGLKQKKLCPENHFQDEERQPSCKKCPPGLFTAKTPGKNGTSNLNRRIRTNSTFCVGCAPGQFFHEESKSCKTCPPARYQDQPGETRCLPKQLCEAGTYDAERFFVGTTRVTNVSTNITIKNYSVNQYPTRNTSTCLICPAGYRCAGGLNDKKKCGPRAFYCPEGSEQEKIAPKGFCTVSNSSQAHCDTVMTSVSDDIDSTTGTISEQNSSRHLRRRLAAGTNVLPVEEETVLTMAYLRACEPGRICDNGEQRMCLIGHYCQNGTSIPCKRGEFCDKPGLQTAPLCPEGFACPDPAGRVAGKKACGYGNEISEAGHCDTCDRNQFASKEKNKCIDCPLNRVKQSTGLETLMTCNGVEQPYISSDAYCPKCIDRCVELEDAANFELYASRQAGISTNTTLSYNSLGNPCVRTECKTGYAGVLCAACDVDFGLVSGGLCVACPDKEYTLPYTAGAMVFSLVFSACVVHRAIYENTDFTTSKMSVITIFINHVQMSGLLVDFNLDWGPTMRYVFGFAGAMGSPVPPLAHCMGVTFKTRTMLMMSAPGIVVFLPAVLWFLTHNVFDKLKRICGKTQNAEKRDSVQKTSPPNGQINSSDHFSEGEEEEKACEDSKEQGPPIQGLDPIMRPRKGSDPRPRKGSDPRPRKGSDPRPRKGSDPRPRKGSDPWTRNRKGSDPRRRSSSSEPPETSEYKLHFKSTVDNPLTSHQLNQCSKIGKNNKPFSDILFFPNKSKVIRPHQ